VYVDKTAYIYRQVSEANPYFKLAGGGTAQDALRQIDGKGYSLDSG
jgi:hypothetical protein